MKIQWYPGHMTKAIRMIGENVKLVDAVLYLLDARAPHSCVNPDFEKLTEGKPTLYLLNKQDLADPKKTSVWVRQFAGDRTSARAVCGTDRSLKAAVVSDLTQLLREKLERNAAKGVRKPLRAMIIGVPNCGKSTVMNTLAGEKRAVTGDKPGVTKGKQWLRLDSGLELLDTPGTLWNAFPDQRVGRHLAYIGSINDDILDLNELALELIGELKTLYPAELAARYGVEVAGTPLEVYEAICRRRGFLVRGGEVDYDRGAKAILDDFRKKRIGAITLEMPEDFS